MTHPGGRPPVPQGQLTERELDVTRELALGYVYGQIARRRGVSTASVAKAAQRGMRRLDARTAAHLVSRAIALRLIPAGTALTAADRAPEEAH